MNILPFEYKTCNSQTFLGSTITIFDNVKLTKQIGKFPIGTIFAHARINFVSGQAIFELKENKINAVSEAYFFNIKKFNK